MNLLFKFMPMRPEGYAIYGVMILLYLFGLFVIENLVYDIITMLIKKFKKEK